MTEKNNGITKISRPELLAPAGDLDKLKTAIHFGADAVYLAYERLGMRKAAKNFSKQDLIEGTKYAHEHHVSVYVTLNIVPHEEDFAELKETIEFLETCGVDAVIVSDPGIFQQVQKYSNLDIHISTQASITNAATINFWHSLGAKRIVLARELSLEEIREIRSKISPEVELEMFVHGAMCISYSGRCLLSNYMTGRDANRGDCAQACRWKYNLVEESRPNEYFPVYEDERGTFIMNSKDLCLLPYLTELQNAGIDSFKIEGRVKTQYYVATVIRAYRQAIDAMKKNALSGDKIQQLLTELKKASHRAYTDGFLHNKPTDKAQNYETSGYIRSFDFVGVVKEYDAYTRRCQFELRNRIKLGDHIEIFGKSEQFVSQELSAIYSTQGERLDQANVPGTIYEIEVSQEVFPGDMIRREI